MKREIESVILIAFTFLLTSCVPAYIPNVINTPLFDSKGEFQASVNTGLSGIDPQLAVSLTDNLGLMINGSFADRTSDTTDDFHKHQFVEIGIGYYKKLEENVIFEVYGGFGGGKLQTYCEDCFLTSYADVNTNRFFIQPAVGVSTSIIDGSFASRLTIISMNQASESNTGIFWEPAITAKVGYKYVKTVFQFGLAVPFNKSSIDFEYQPFLFSVGLLATFGKY